MVGMDEGVRGSEVRVDRVEEVFWKRIDGRLRNRVQVGRKAVGLKKVSVFMAML